MFPSWFHRETGGLLAAPANVTSLSPWSSTGILLDRHRGAIGAPDATSISMLEVVAASLNVIQVDITLSRLATHVPEVLIRPRLLHNALMDFHRAGVAISEGARAAETALPDIERIGEQTGLSLTGWHCSCKSGPI